MNNTGLHIFLRISSKRCRCGTILSGLIRTVKLIDILNEFPVQKMKRYILGTDTGTLPTVRTPSGYMECPDNMEHIFFEGIGRCLLCNAGIRIIEYALFTGTGRTYIPAGITADTLGKLFSPKCKPFVAAHGFQFLYLSETIRLLYFPLFSQKLIVCYMLLALTA
jgi:hypothetical protein